jgi:hypothetical protein
VTATILSRWADKARWTPNTVGCSPMLPPMLHIDGSSTEASTMRYFLEFLQLLVGKIGWSDPGRVLRHDIVLDRLLTMAGAGGAYCSRWRERPERAVPVLSFAKCTMLRDRRAGF